MFLCQICIFMKKNNGSWGRIKQILLLPGLVFRSPITYLLFLNVWLHFGIENSISREYRNFHIITSLFFSTHTQDPVFTFQLTNWVVQVLPLVRTVHIHHVHRPMTKQCIVIIPSPLAQMPDLHCRLAWLGLVCGTPEVHSGNSSHCLTGPHQTPEERSPRGKKCLPYETPEQAPEKGSKEVELSKREGEELFCGRKQSQRDWWGVQEPRRKM